MFTLAMLYIIDIQIIYSIQISTILHDTVM